MEHGYIKIWRKMSDWEWEDHPIMFWFFIRLIFMANWKDKRWHGILIKRGQFISSYDELRFIHKNEFGKKVKLGTQVVRTMVKRLKSTGELTCTSTNNFTLFTIEKYNTYQNFDILPTNESTDHLTNDQQTTNKRPTTTKELEALKKKEGGAFAPPSLVEVQSYCSERKNKVNSQSFIDFYTSKGWFVGKNKMKDWRAAVRTWEQRQQPFVSDKSPPVITRGQDQEALDKIKQWEKEMEDEC